jgi:hypothetical protein
MVFLHDSATLEYWAATALAVLVVFGTTLRLLKVHLAGGRATVGNASARGKLSGLLLLDRRGGPDLNLSINHTIKKL